MGIRLNFKLFLLSSYYVTTSTSHKFPEGYGNGSFLGNNKIKTYIILYYSFSNNSHFKKYLIIIEQLLWYPSESFQYYYIM